ncbi:transmembrane emp24 domain-containing protein 5 isoform X2 [Mustelus asterias]
MGLSSCLLLSPLFLCLFSDWAQVSLCFPQSFDSDFTFTLPAGHKECFYQTMKKDATLEIEYQVIDGAGLDVDFYIASPNGNILYFDQRKSDGVHSVETENGDYMFCFDNSFSSISEKIVFFELILDNMEPESDANSWKDFLQGGELLDMKLEDILLEKMSTPLRMQLRLPSILRAIISQVEVSSGELGHPALLRVKSSDSMELN